MKKIFTTKEIRDLYNRFFREEINFTRMVEIMNEMVSEPEEPVRKFKKGDKVRVKESISSRTHGNVGPGFMSGMDDFIGKTMTVSRYTHKSGYVVCNEYDWNFNEDWLEPYVEDIPKRKFQKGDKVRIKDGISSRTTHGQYPVFQPSMDDFIGTIMTINRYEDIHDYVICNESDWRFNEDWLEPYTDEPKKGDLAIFWDEKPSDNVIRFYKENMGENVRFPHIDSNDGFWRNAIKFESKEQYEKLIKEEI